MHKLETQHPLRIITKAVESSAQLSRLERLVLKMSERSRMARPIIWFATLGRASIWGVRWMFGRNRWDRRKIKAAERFNAWLQAQNPLDIIMYTDGSQIINQDNTIISIGAGWVLNWVGSWYSKRGISLGKSYEVYDAEAIAMLEGLKQALSSPMARVASGIHICLDNIRVARMSSLIPMGSSQEIFKQFRILAKEWLQTGKKMTVQWIPSHVGIEGNELADKEARKQTKLPPSAERTDHQTLSSAKRKIRKMKDNAWQLEWQKGGNSTATQTYLDLGLKPTSRAKSLPELRFKRQVQGWLIAARSGHGHFAAYHERFGHEATDSNCLCGQKRSQLHPFSCTYARKYRLHLRCNKRQRQLAPDEVLGTPEGVTVFAKWAPATGLFNRRYGGEVVEGDGTDE